MQARTSCLINYRSQGPLPFPLSKAITDGRDSSFIFLQNRLALLNPRPAAPVCLFTSHAFSRLLIFRGTSYLVVINTSNTEDIVLLFAELMEVFSSSTNYTAVF